MVQEPQSQVAQTKARKQRQVEESAGAKRVQEAVTLVGVLVVNVLGESVHSLAQVFHRKPTTGAQSKSVGSPKWYQWLEQAESERDAAELVRLQ